jgi:hypothetical protein
MFFCATRNVSVLCLEIKLGVTPGNTPKGNFAIALNRIWTIPVPPYGNGPKMTSRFFKSIDENIHNTYC